MDVDTEDGFDSKRIFTTRLNCTVPSLLERKVYAMMCCLLCDFDRQKNPLHVVIRRSTTARGAKESIVFVSWRAKNALEIVLMFLLLTMKCAEARYI